MPLDFSNSHARKETIESILCVAVALRQNQALNPHQSQLAASVLFDYLRLLESRAAGGQKSKRKPILDTPEAEANRRRVREYRERKKTS